MSEYIIIDLEGEYKCRRCKKKAVRLIVDQGLFLSRIIYYCEEHYLEWLEEKTKMNKEIQKLKEEAKNKDKQIAGLIGDNLALQNRLMEKEKNG